MDMLHLRGENDVGEDALSHVSSLRAAAGLGLIGAAGAGGSSLHSLRADPCGTGAAAPSRRSTSREHVQVLR